MVKTSVLFLLGLICLSSVVNATSLHHRAHTSASNAYRHYVGDFDGDGASDFIRQKSGGWSDDGKDTVQLFTSSGRGTFHRTTLDSNFKLDGELVDLYVGDFNGDGRDDILRREKGSWANDKVNTANLLLSGKGDFQKIDLDENFSLSGKHTNLYIGDFNGDGKDDILRQEKGDYAKDSVSTAYLLLSTGNNFKKIVLSEDLKVHGDLTNLYVGDFNGDGKDDVLRQEKGSWAKDDVNMAQILMSNGESFKIITLPDDFKLNGDLTVLNIADFNGDGLTDILRREKGSWANDKVNTANILLSQGDGNFLKVILDEDLKIPATLTNVYIGDYNGDGKADFFRQEKGDWADDAVNMASVSLYTGFSFQTVAYPYDKEMSGEVSTLLIGDFNADGMDDFIQNWNLDTYYLHIAQGDGYFF